MIRKWIMRRKVTQDIIEDIVTQYGAVVAFCLKDKLGFGKKRAQRFMGEVDSTLYSITTGHLTLDEVLEVVREELDIRF